MGNMKINKVYLKRIYIDNFRTLVNFELKLDHLTLLLGDNGAGKTTVFDVLRRLREFVSGRMRVDEAFAHTNLTRWQMQPIQRFELDFEINKQTYSYKLEVESNPEIRKSRVIHEVVSLDSKPLLNFTDGFVQLYNDKFNDGPRFPMDWTISGLSIVSDRNDNRKLTAFRKQMEKLIVVSLIPQQISSISREEQNQLVSTGENFPSWWRVMSQERPDLIAESFDQLRKVFSNLRLAWLKDDGGNSRKLTLRFSPPPEDENLIAPFSETEQSDVEYTFDELSDGQRVLFILYTLVIGLKGQGYLLFLDEPENFVSLPEIQPWLMLLSDTVSNGLDQACIISHHPEQINYLGAEHGIWIVRSSGGPSRIVKPSFKGDKHLSLSEAVARGWTS